MVDSTVSPTPGGNIRMATQLSHESDFAYDFVPIEGAPYARAASAQPLPVFDLFSDEPLPDLPDMLAQPAFGLPGANSPGFDQPGFDQPGPNQPADSLDAFLAPMQPSQPGAPERIDGAGGLFIDGDVVMCPCPDCRAPMAIRLWLMVADCWQCGTSIELSEEQEREAKRLMEERERRVRQTAKAPGARPAAKRTAPADRSRTAAKSHPEPRPAKHESPRPAKQEARRTTAKTATPPAPPAAPPQPPPAAQPAAPSADPTAKKRPPKIPESRRPPGPAAPPSRAKQRSTPPPPPPAAPPAQPRRRTDAATAMTRRRIQQVTVAGTTRAWISRRLKETPAWLVSLVFHMVLLTILGLLTFPPEPDPSIMLTATVSKDRQDGGDTVEIKPLDEASFDLPLPDNVNLDDTETREAMVKADQEAKELRIDPDSANPNLPDLAQVKRMMASNSPQRRMLAMRDPRVRVEMVKKEGGTTLTEAAVARGLKWLAGEQRRTLPAAIQAFPEDIRREKEAQILGSWSLGGGQSPNAAGTALALMPFLGAGQTHLAGRYQDNVSLGLRWLVNNQGKDGDFTRRGYMYAQGVATLVVCDAYALTGDGDLREPAQRGVDFIVNSQHTGGGWRYAPRQPGDTSVVGWQLMALQSARAAGLEVPESTFELASHFLDRVQSRNDLTYGYMRAGDRPRKGPMTAVGVLCRMYLGRTKDDPDLVSGIKFLADRELPNRQSPDAYLWYYGTQVMHHAGGQEWDKWNLHMRDILVNTQHKAGDRAGSWPALGHHTPSGYGGSLYMTALAVCTLEVYYRHAPIYRQIDLGE